MTEKTYLTANDLLRGSFRLGKRVLDCGFAPIYLVGIWRSSAPVGTTVQELLEFARGRAMGLKLVAQAGEEGHPAYIHVRSTRSASTASTMATGRWRMPRSSRDWPMGG